MAAATENVDELVDAFVSYLNAAGFEPKSLDEVPEELRQSSAEHGTCHWRIRPASPNPWVETLDAKLPQGWPKIFRSLLDRYRFCDFEIGPLMVFSNTGHDLFYELSERAFKDSGLFPTLHKNGFLQVGLPHECNYDPVCFDMKRRIQGDAPIVQLDHEQILQWSRIRVVREIAPSFAQFIRRAMNERFAVA